MVQFDTVKFTLTTTITTIRESSVQITSTAYYKSRLLRRCGFGPLFGHFLGPSANSGVWEIQENVNHQSYCKEHSFGSPSFAVQSICESFIIMNSSNSSIANRTKRSSFIAHNARFETFIILSSVRVGTPMHSLQIGFPFNNGIMQRGFALWNTRALSHT